MIEVHLKHWAESRGIPTSTAYRWFRLGKLPENVKARKDPSGSIMVEITPEDPLANIDPHALVQHLREAGYVVLTEQQAEQLGIHTNNQRAQNDHTQ